MKQVVIINGKPKAGKLTFVNAVGRHLKVRWRNSIDPFKELARNVGWDGTLGTPANRSFLCALKAASIKYTNYPFHWAEREIADFMESDDDVLFLSIREVDEIKKLVRAYPSIISILIARKKSPRIQNPADKDVEKYMGYTYEIANDGYIRDLEMKATKFASALIAREQKRKKANEKFRYSHQTDDMPT